MSIKVFCLFFFVAFFYFLVLSCIRCLYILKINPLLVVSFANILSQAVGCLFILFMVKEIQPVHPKGSQSWIFIGKTDAEADSPIFWLPDAKNWHSGKELDTRKDWRCEEKGTTEDDMVGWHYQHDGHKFEQAPSVSDVQGSLVCCSPRGCKELDMTEWLNWTEDAVINNK